MVFWRCCLDLLQVLIFQAHAKNIDRGLQRICIKIAPGKIRVLTICGDRKVKFSQTGVNGGGLN